MIRRFFQKPDKGVLYGVLRLLGVAQNGQRRPVQAVLILCDKCLVSKRRIVAAEIKKPPSPREVARRSRDGRSFGELPQSGLRPASSLREEAF